MDLNDTPERAVYRARLRGWLQENARHAPAEAPGLHVADVAGFRAWQRRLAEAGYAGIMWPREYGGQGLGPMEQAIVNAELGAAGLPGVLDMIGVGNLGPTLIAHGTAAQKERHLRPLLHAEEMWCQLFSEPAAGSDLAAVRTRAARTGDGGWRLDGQKVWTTNAQHAAFGLLLARTDPAVPKHRGLTMFVVPMRAPGVAVRPLRQIGGEAGFNEVFLDGVALGADAVVGEVGAGWSVAMTCLMYERFTLLTAIDQVGVGPDTFLGPLVGTAEVRRPDVLRRLGRLTADLYALRYTAYRALTAVDRGRVPGPEAGLGKITLIDAAMEGLLLQFELLGPESLEGPSGRLMHELQGLRSGGGTHEVLRNTIGERVLGLPAEPRADKDVPFQDLAS
ncbi:acyl-CoA dehydrogenase family protein [Actinomadura sp. NPDC000600]|uniref:acyl-CoA dehydrogenase family protein n=1 Tax=Actinomadura sp. NPDC000600 TaxID=3154262 RepID=UPI00339614A9